MIPWNISRRFVRVWERNLRVYRRTWAISFIPPVLEPVLYLLAFGVGLSALVGSVQYQGSQISYVAFIAPSLLSINIMYNAFFENTYASFVRMYYQKTFDAMLATPLSLEEVITGEIVWGATKSLMATILMQSVVSLFGLVHYPQGLLILPLAILGGIAFGSLGMLFTALVPHIEMFNLPIFLLISPMFLFSGTFFPLEVLPAWVKPLAWALPLTHLVEAARSLALGQVRQELLWHVLYLGGMSALLFPLAVGRMRARLIR
jgi:lipooligosaccharide transport system permease protein